MLRAARPSRLTPESLHPPQQFRYCYTSDGKTIGYPIRENGLYALWVSPVDGSPGHRVTEFEADRIEDFHWTPDGKTLGLLRTHSDSDVVLLRQTTSSH